MDRGSSIDREVDTDDQETMTPRMDYTPTKDASLAKLKTDKERECR
ncbi:MAG: hypothetical protein R3B95_10510 [Nitrospirales bacterium]|nr:hypothetical protein [Nitrospirales bacterium]